jgi:CHAT domain-containing protein
MSHLAEVFTDQQMYDQAEDLFEKAMAMAQATMGPDNFFTIRIYESACRLNRLTGKDRKALHLAKRAATARRSNLVENAAVLAEADALSYSERLRRSTGIYLTCFLELRSSDHSDTTSAADIVLSNKGQISDEIFERSKALAEETDSTTVAIMQSLLPARYRMSKLFIEGPGEDVAGYHTKVDSLRNVVDEYESDLSRRSASFRKLRGSKEIGVTRISSLLPDRSILVEYAKYDYFKLAPDTTAARYMVAVLDRTGCLFLSDLGDASKIDGLANMYRDHMQRIASAGGALGPSDEQIYRRIAERLRRLIWEPVERYVNERDMVLIAPDGALNMIAFAAMIDSEGRYLVERFPIHYLMSGRDMIRLKGGAEAGEGLLALGDPDYHAPASSRTQGLNGVQTKEGDSALHGTSKMRSTCLDLREMEVERLPGTRREVEWVAERWKESSDEYVVTCFGSEASEERFKIEAPGKRVIHLATHGYFLGGKCQMRLLVREAGGEIGYAGENPLLFSGLLLAGAALAEEEHDDAGADDGILTAYEVSAMDLSSAELVVLSACESGLGEIEEGEGVYGLRRAFQMAGARAVVSTLWPVSDEATANMMNQLYSRRWQSIPEAMRETQIDKIIEVRGKGLPDHPFGWAGFIAVGDWR